MKTKVKTAIIGGACGIVCAVISAYGGYKGGYDKGYENGEIAANQEVENQLEQVVNIEGMGSEEAIKYIISRIEELENENTALSAQRDGEKVNEDETIQEGVPLFSVAQALNPCDAYEEKVTESMSLRGRNFSNGFIMHYWGDNKEVEFYLGGKYSTMSFKIGHLDESDKTSIFSLTYTLDGIPQESISMKAEDPVQEKNINLKNANYIKFSWSNDKGFSEYGMADIIVQ